MSIVELYSRKWHELTRHRRDAAWVSHIPWALAFVSFLPGATKKWDEMKVVGEKTAEYRLSLGSTHRDLFHHLVRIGLFVVWLMLNRLLLDGRGRTRASEALP